LERWLPVPNPNESHTGEVIDVTVGAMKLILSALPPASSPFDTTRTA
jgi:hypothetical protein